MGREELKGRQLAHHHQLMSQQGPHFSPHSKAKANNKLVTSGISDVVTASVYSENTLMKKLVLIAHGHQKLTSAMKQRPEK